MTPGSPVQARGAVAEIDLGAFRANVRTLAARAPGAELMVVVKADAYGHGAVEVSQAAVDEGVRWLGVALVEEGQVLREAGIGARILLLSQPPDDAASAVVRHDLTPTLYRGDFAEALAKAVAGADLRRPFPVHLKIDTGMHRVGCSADDAVGLALDIQERPELALEGVMTHLAVADEPDNPFTAEQLRRFAEARSALAAAGIDPPLVHAANSAATLRSEEAHFDLVRCGIAAYGIPPSPALAGAADLVPVMRLRACVSHVARLHAGEAVSYGQRYRLEREATIAVVPMGYGDGVPRRLGHVGGEVLIGGRRHPIAGTITMDQLMVDVGDEVVHVGDEVVLLGSQGAETITATEIAQRLDTIGYEITCGIGPRVPRIYWDG